MNVLDLRSLSFFQCTLLLFIFCVSQSKFGRQHEQLFGWENNSWNMAATCEREKRTRNAKLEIFVPNPESESDCDTNELFWLSPLPVLFPFPFRSPFFAGQVAVLGTCAYLCAYFFYATIRVSALHFPCLLSSALPLILLGMQIYGVSRNNCYCVFQLLLDLCF